MPLFALAECHWNGVHYEAGDEVPTDGLDQHGLRELVTHLPVYGTDPKLEQEAWGTALALSMAFGT